MRKRWVTRALKMLPIGIAAVAVFGFVVMGLWNWLVPAIFGWKAIGFWQALGLLLLSKILFGGLRGHSNWRHRFQERWERMTPEERERFRESMRNCAPHHTEPAA